MNFDVIKNPAAKHYCSDNFLDGEFDNFPVGTIVRCTICGQFWKATSRITVTDHDGTIRKVPQWRRLYWRTMWTRHVKEWMIS